MENNNMMTYTDEELQKMTERVQNIPPITGDMLKDYTGLLLKEIAALAGVWKIYKAENTNILMNHHMEEMSGMYDRLMEGISVFVQPENIEGINPDDKTEE